MRKTAGKEANHAAAASTKHRNALASLAAAGIGRGMTTRSVGATGVV